VKEPRLAEDITKALGMVDKKTRLQKEILEKLKDQMSITAQLDETIRFKRPPLVPGDDRKLYVDVDTIRSVTDKVVEAEKKEGAVVPDARRPTADIELEEKLIPESIKKSEERLKTSIGLTRGRHKGLSYIIGKAKMALRGGRGESGSGLGSDADDMVLNI
jgi:hypothetical protein